MRQVAPHKTHRLVAKLIAELVKGQGTRIELSKRTGLDRQFISRMLAALKEQNCVYIVQWDRDETGRRQQAVFTLGFGEDAPRPPALTQQERDQKRYRRKKSRELAEQAKPIKTQFIGGPLWT